MRFVRVNTQFSKSHRWMQTLNMEYGWFALDEPLRMKHKIVPSLPPAVTHGFIYIQTSLLSCVEPPSLVFQTPPPPPLFG